MTIVEDENIAGWRPGRTVEARLIFITSDEIDYAIYESWRQRVQGWETVELNDMKVVPTLQWRTAWRPSHYTSVDMRVVPSTSAVSTWTNDIVSDSTAWFSNLVAETLATLPDLTFDRAELEVR